MTWGSTGRRLLTTLIVAVVLCLIALALVHLPPVQQGIFPRVLRLVPLPEGTSLQVEGARWNLLKGRIELEGIEATGSRPDRQEPITAAGSRIRIEGLVADVRLRSLLRGRLVLSLLEIRRPDVRLLTDPEGRLILPSLPQEETEGSADSTDLPPVQVDRLHLLDGAFELAPADPTRDLTVRATGLNLDGELSLVELQAKGRISLKEARLSRGETSEMLTATRADWIIEGPEHGEIVLSLQLGELTGKVEAEIRSLLHEPTYEARVRIDGPVAPLTVLAGSELPLEGTVTVELDAEGGISGPPGSARLRFRGGSLAALGWRAEKIELDATTTGGRLESAELSARTAGGEIILRGSGTLLPRPAGLEVEGTVKAVELEELLGPLGLPVWLRGTASAGIAGRMEGSDPVESLLTLELTVAQDPGSEATQPRSSGDGVLMTPSVELRGSWDHGTVVVPRISLRDGATVVRGSGQWAWKDGNFSADLAADSPDLTPYLALAGLEGAGTASVRLKGAGELPETPEDEGQLELSGSIRAQGLRFGETELEKVELELRADRESMELSELRIAGMGFAARGEAGGRWRLPSLDGARPLDGRIEIQLPEWSHQGRDLPALTAVVDLGRPLSMELRSVDGSIDASMQVPSGGALEVAAVLSDLQLESFQGFFPDGAAAITGSLSGSVGASIPRGRDATGPQASVRLHQLALSSGRLVLTADETLALKLEDQTIRVESLSLRATDGSRVVAQGPLDLAGGSSDLRVELDIPDLGAWSALAGGPRLEGTLTADLALRGSLEEPRPRGRLSARSIRIQDLELGSLDVMFEPGVDDEWLRSEATLDELRWQENAIPSASLQATLEPDAMRLSAKLFEGQASIKARVSRLEDPHLQASIRLVELDLGRITRLAGLEVPLTGRADGQAELHGPISLSELGGDLRLDRLTLDAEDLHLEARDPIRLGLQGGRLRADSMRLEGTGLDIGVTGSIDLLAREPAEGIDASTLTLDLDSDLVALLPLAPELDQLEGIARARLRVLGSVTAPQLRGSLTLSKVALNGPILPAAVEELNGELRFDRAGVTIDSVETRFAQGHVSLSGAIGLDGLVPGGVDLALTARNLNLRYPENAHLVLGADLTVRGTMPRIAVAGEVRMIEALYEPRMGLLPLLQSIVTVPVETELTEEDGSPPPVVVDFDVAILAPRGIRIQNPSLDLDLAAQLQLAGSSEDPVLLGTAEMARGYLRFLRTEYDLQRGVIRFSDPLRIDPWLDIVAVSRPNAQMTLRITGQASEPVIDLSSSSGMSDMEIARMMVGGVSADSGGDVSTWELVGRYASQAMIDALAEAMSLRTDLTIEPFPVTPEGESFLVGIGKRVTQDLTLTYYISGSSGDGNSISARFSATPRTVLEARQNRDGSVSGGVRYRYEFH